jgi:YD repeat-containing protein
VYYRTDDYFFDSLGRKTMHIIWTKKEGNKKYIYSYEDKGNYTIVRESLKKEITRTESNYLDTSQHLYIERAWYGESTIGAPPHQHKYNMDGKLVMASSYNGFTEYRYDSLGTLTYMLMRQFEEGHCAGYSPFNYQPVYSGSRLVEYTSRWSTTTFTYDDKGFITVQKIRMKSENRVHTIEAEYVYYSQ